MSIFSLKHTFRRSTTLGISILTKYHHTSKHVELSKVSPLLLSSNINKQHLEFSKNSLINFSPRSINLDLDLPVNGSFIKNIIENPVPFKHEIEDPLKSIVEKTDIPLDISIDLPTSNYVIPKSAKKKVSMVIIRRRKMKKFKRKKHRKRLAALLLKIRKRRGIQRQKLFHAELWAKVKEAKKFDAKEYVKNRVDLLVEERIPPVYRGCIMPVAMVKKFMEEDKKKEELIRSVPVLKL